MAEPIKIEKYYNDKSEVAVLYAPGYGAGWSSWGDIEYQEFKLFDKGLVELVLQNRHDEVEKYMADKFPGEYTCSLAWDQLEVEWMKPGTQFEITEYDGYESIEYCYGKPWHHA